MDINSSTKKHPKQVIREYLDEPEEETSFFDGVTENLTKLLDGISFSIGLTRFRTWLMILLTVLSTYACSEVMFNLRWETSLAVVAVGTVFPVVFSIQAAYQNREKSLKYLDDIKATFIYMYFTFGEWDRLHSGNVQPEAEATMSQLIVDIMAVLRGKQFGGVARESVHKVYDGWHQLCADAHRNTKVPPPWVNGMSISIRVAMSAFESVKTLKDYETPRGLRKLCYFLIMTTPILLAPYWANFCIDNPDEIEWGCLASYFVGVLYVIITSTLLHVQEALEDPFDGDGIDDIKWDLFGNQLDIMALHGPEGPKQRAEYRKEMDEMRAAKKEAQEQAKEGYQEADVKDSKA